MQKGLSYNYKKLEFDFTLYWSFEDVATSFISITEVPII